MMEVLKVTDKPSEVGYYSGIVDSLFAVCELFTICHWGKLSDRIGRKPVLTLGLAGVALSSTSFGFSKSLPWAVFSRSIAGALSGNAAMVTSVISEITDETNQAQAFPLIGLSWSLGVILGPMIGGTFVNPIETHPKTFGIFPLFRDYPFLLPCLISSILTVGAMVLGAIFLRESHPARRTLDSRLPLPSSTRQREKSTCKNDGSARSILKSEIIRTVLKNYFLLSILGTSFDVVFVLFAYTPVRLGGLSRNPSEIGYAMAFIGIAGAVVQVIIFPRLQYRYDNLPLYRFLMFFWPAIFGSLPLLNLVARWTMPVIVTTATVESGEPHFPASPWLWVCVCIVLAVVRFTSMTFSLNVILI
ncbi:MFS general substrate transporter [Rickenella mellea]|uniref:MFS general substrate transporter n=1 Tax=Rickenella mellea TaxID=50990 RepID=A0A4Y7QA51_9AGAM|nr:MFS general substrate transporter [Rickenella mellea]